MKEYDLYNDDLLFNPRQAESSSIVLTNWIKDEDSYAPVFPPLDEKMQVAARQFYSITAERIFFRRKILGLYDAEDDFIGKRLVRNAQPFGESGPTLSALLDASVNVAMTYVPLAPMQSSGESVLARLYCVFGLDGQYAFPFACEDVNRSIGLNWFLSGLDCQVKPSGKSWQLASEVLAYAVRELHARTDIRRRLATKYAFTGGVDRGSKVVAVEKIAEKTCLGLVQEYGKLTWILPRDNYAEAGKVRATSVATLDDAYKLVVDIDPETENLLSLVKNGVKSGELRNIYSHLRNGADANAVQPDGRNARQMIMASIQRKIVGLIRRNDLKGKNIIEIQNEIRKTLAPEWDAEKASSYYGNDPLLFFLAARSGDDMLIQALRAKMDINAVDRDGETALDFAIEAGDKEVEKRLRRAGATHRGIYALNSKRVRAFLRDPEAEFAADGGKFIMTALDSGLDSIAETNFGVDENGEQVKRKRELWDNDKAKEDPWNRTPMSEYEYGYTSVLKEAILIKKRILVEKCLEVLKKASRAVPEEYVKLASQYSSPLIIKDIREYCGVKREDPIVTTRRKSDGRTTR